MHVRRDIWSLQSVDVWEPITLAYARAVAAMRQRDPEDPTSWRYQAAIHGSREAPREGWNQCQHRSWWFLPWHRMYIFRFEEIVRSIVAADGGPADWALPYWNYSKGFPSNTLPPAFREPRLPDGGDNPLFVAEPGRNPAGINRGAAMPEFAVETDTALTEESFTPPPPPGFGGTAVAEPAHFADRAFTGALENVPHNVVHGLVGGPFETGWMSDPDRAAEDPIFWLHHSNIDRLWAKWRRDGGADPADPGFLEREYPLFDSSGSPVTMRVGDVIDPAREVNLDYRYDDEGAGRPQRARPQVAAVTAAAGGSGETRTLAATGAVELAGPTSVALPMPPATRALASAARAPGGRLLLTVEDIEVVEDTGTVYAVYLGDPEDVDERVLAGHITFFGASHMHHAGHGGGISNAYDVTAIVERLEREGRWQGDEQRVTFVPVGLVPPPGEEPAAGTQAPTRARVGRVTLAGAAIGPAPRAAVPPGAPTPGPGEVLAWEDDPGQPPSVLVPVVRPPARLAAPRLSIAIVDPRPPEGPPADQAAFLWWAAADALERGRDLMARLLPDVGGWQPQVGPTLRVHLDADPPQFNAYYDRNSLTFFHDTIAGVTCWSGESPDIVCHELGHAVLDAIRPQLWDAAGTEPAAFHESFGDITALLTALELQELREHVLEETAGKPWRSSRVSRVAEQLGWAIRRVSPDRAEPNCLRDASNSWFYRDPATLPPEAPASQLSTEPHFFARIFTGAALKAVAGMFDMQARHDEAALRQAGRDFGVLLVDAIGRAPVVPGYFSQIAAHVLEADAQRFGGRHQDALRFAFVRHGVLALSSANALARGAAAGRGMAGPPPDAATAGDLPETAVDGAAFGLPGPLMVQACGHPKRFGVAGAAPDTGGVATAGSDRTAELFVEDLFRQGRVDAGAAAGTSVLTAPLAYKTHVLESADAGFALRRRVFDCGLHPPGGTGSTLGA